MSRQISGVGGTNALHWPHPYERDTTRGWSQESFQSMHSDQVEQTMKIASCACCGNNFGFVDLDDKRARYCPSHRWLAGLDYLGEPIVLGIEYRDSQSDALVTGKSTRWVYRYDLHDVDEARKFAFVIRAWLNEEYLERHGLHDLPKLHVNESGRMFVLDVQRVCSDHHSVDLWKLRAFFNKCDRLYVENF